MRQDPSIIGRRPGSFLRGQPRTRISLTSGDDRRQRNICRSAPFALRVRGGRQHHCTAETRSTMKVCLASLRTIVTIPHACGARKHPEVADDRLSLPPLRTVRVWKVLGKTLQRLQCQWCTKVGLARLRLSCSTLRQRGS